MPEPISTTAILRGVAIAARVAGIKIPGISSISSIFGGGGGHKIRLPSFKIQKKLFASRGIKIPFGNLSSSSFHRLGPKIAQQQKAFAKAKNTLRNELRSFSLVSDLDTFNSQIKRLNLHHASSPGDAFKRAQQQINLFTSTITGLDQFRIDNPDNPAVRSLVKEPDIQRGVDKKQIGRIALRAARGFIRLPKQEFRSSGFVSRGSAGFRDISELEQDVDRIIPSGFISKQPTTQSRALALRSLS